MSQAMEVERRCYCHARESDPKWFEAEEIPAGFCAICDVCGEPGHTREASHVHDVFTSRPLCDRHYGVVFNPRWQKKLDRAIYLFFFAGVIALLAFRWFI